MYSGDENYDDDVTSGFYMPEYLFDKIAPHVTFSADGRKATIKPDCQVKNFKLLEMVMRYNRGERFV